MYRLNQRVCRVEWADGQPYIRVAKVTKVTTRTYYVDNEPSPARMWHERTGLAIKEEFRDLFRMWDTMFGSRPADWTEGDTVRCVCRLQRLARKVRRHRRHAGEHQPRKDTP